jgi:hypothetical protein
MVTEMVYASVFWFNIFPTIDDISTTMSPHTIIAGLTLNYTKPCCVEFGTYIQVHEEDDNKMPTQTTGAIALCQLGMPKAATIFLVQPLADFLIATGGHCFQCLVMSLTMCMYSHNAVMQKLGLAFTDHTGESLDDDNDSDDKSDNFDNNYDDYVPNAANNITGVNGENENENNEEANHDKNEAKIELKQNPPGNELEGCKTTNQTIMRMLI